MQKFMTFIKHEKFQPSDFKKVECFILSADLSADFKQKFAFEAQKEGKLVLSESSSDCQTYHLDGVLLDLSKSENIHGDYENAVKSLKNKFVGVICRNRRHEAMLCSECEPDFVVFRAWQDGADKIRELTSWYAEMFLIQCALLPMEKVDYASFATDFVILDDEVCALF